MALASTLLALPVLCLVSIPLILSAWVTFSLALFTLLVRLSVVYFGVGYDMLVSFFTLPISTISFLTFAASQPPTPVSGNSRRNSAYDSMTARWSNDLSSSWTYGAVDDAARYNKSKNIYARNMAEAHYLPASPRIGLPVSGDERRDFEGVGGWRSYPSGSNRHSNRRSSQPSREKPLSHGSSSSTQSINGELRDDTDIDADDRDWLLLNHRLELPSQSVTLRSAANSPTLTMDMHDSRRGSNFHPAFNAFAHSPKTYHATGHKHHHRSHTTSALPQPSSGVTTPGLSLSMSNRPEISSPFTRESDHVMTPSASRMTPFMTHTRPSTRTRTFPMTGPIESHIPESFYQMPSAGNSGVTSPASGSGGYFALPRPGSQNRFPSPSASGYTTPGVGMSNEERDASSLHWTRLMAHYPTSLRHRRRSISGPHARRMSQGERLA